MADLFIRKAGDPILKAKASEVKKIDKKIKILLDDMLKIMDKSNGVGLAAPQVGISLRIAIVDVGDGLVEMINPRIEEFEGEQLCEQEGCLSVPEYFGTVRRAMRVKVSAIDRNGKKQTFWAEGFKAQAIQHELDHLDGILFLDRATSVVKIEDKPKGD